MTARRMITEITKEMINQNLSVRELANKAGLWPNTISRWTSYECYPSLPSLCKLADALGLEIVVRKKGEK